MKKYLYIALAALGMMGCEEELDRVSSGSGFLISLGDAPVSMETKSTPEELGEPLKTNFSIEVLKQSTGESETYKYEENLVIPASVGVYDITASYGDNPELALDAPYYEGKAEDEEIKEGATDPVSVTIECKVANALASVVYEDEAKFQELFSSYGLNVKVGNFNVTLNNSNAGKSAYYQAGSKPTFTFVGTLKGNGKEVTKSLTAEDNSALGEDATFAAAKHCILTLSLGTTEPGVNLTLSKVKVEEVRINETIPLEWLPAPKVSATGFDEATKTLDFYETNTPAAASIDFEVNEATGLQDLEFSLNFKDETFQELTGDYTLSTMSDEDKAKFADAGITLPLAGQTSPKIDFTSTFINQLRAKDEGAVVNTITINKVTANNRPNKDESPLVYTINTHKPEFTVEVWDGNVWSKTFTAEEITVTKGKGNLETIKQNLVYQYSTDGDSWTDFSDQTTRTQTFAEHPSGDDYKVRAYYRGALASIVKEITLEENKPVPNGDMEAWTATTRRTVYDYWFGQTNYDRPYYLPWNENENVEIWWDTNNNATIPSSVGTPGYIDYKSFPTTAYTESGVSGKAVEIRSVAVNGANSEIAHYGDTRGILYAGITSNDGTMTEGRDWPSRPTALSFQFKYDSYKTERMGAYVELYSGETKIASGEFVSGRESYTTFQNATVTFTYTNETLKATSIRIKFQSVAGDESVETRKLEVSLPSGSYTIYGGSVLTLDNIALVYDK